MTRLIFNAQWILVSIYKYFKHIERDTDGKPSIFASEAMNIMLQAFGDSKDQAKDIKMDIIVFTDDLGKAFPGYLVCLCMWLYRTDFIVRISNEFILTLDFDALTFYGD